MTMRGGAAPAAIEAGMRSAMRRSWLVVHLSAVAIIVLSAVTLFADGERYPMSAVIAFFGSVAFMWASISLVMWVFARSHLQAARLADAVVDVAGSQLAEEIDAQRENWT